MEGTRMMVFMEYEKRRMLSLSSKGISAPTKHHLCTTRWMVSFTTEMADVHGIIRVKVVYTT